MNAVCPNIVRTNISSEEFYSKAEARGLIVDKRGVLQAFEAMMGDSTMSGECLEISPANIGYTIRAPAEVLDEASQESIDILVERSLPLVQP